MTGTAGTSNANSAGASTASASGPDSLLLLVLAIGLVLRLIGIGWGLPNQLALGEPPFHPDEKVAFQQGVLLYNDPTGTTFIWGGCFYPRMARWVRAAALSVLPYPADHGLVYTIVGLRFANVVLALLSAWLVGWMAREVIGPGAGALAAGLFLFAPGHVLASHFARPDVLLAALCAASLACAIRVSRDGNNRFLVGGAFLGGLATATLLSGAIAFVPLGVAWLEFQFLRGYVPRSGFMPRNKLMLWRARRFVAAAGWIGAGALCGWLAGNFEALLFWDAFVDGLGISSRTHNPTGYGFPTLLLTTVSVYAFGIVAALGTYAGLAFFILRRRPGALTLASSLVTGYLLLGRVGGEMMRYLLFIAPAAAIAATLALRAAPTAMRALGRSTETNTGRSTEAKLWLVQSGGSLVALAWTLHLSLGWVLPLQSDEDARYRAGRWIQAHAESGSTVGMTTSYAYDWTYAPRVPVDAKLRQSALMVRSKNDSSGYLDLGLDWIAISDYALLHARGETAPQFFRDLFSGKAYRLAHTEAPPYAPLSIPLALGIRLPGDLHYVRPTFYVFQRDASS